MLFFSGFQRPFSIKPVKNNIYVSFTQDKVLREEIQKTEIEILSEKADLMYVIDTEDRSNGLTDGSMTPGRNFAIRGAYLRVEGDDPAVGITFVNVETKAQVKLTSDMFAVNNPSELIFLVPTGLPDGNYELTICTQYSRNKVLLKQPRSVSVSVHVGNSGGSDSESPDEI